MSTEQIEQNDNQAETGHANIEAGSEGQEFNSDLEQLRNEREQLVLQLTQAQDRLARLQAEFDNTRKREAKGAPGRSRLRYSVRRRALPRRP